MKSLSDLNGRPEFQTWINSTISRYSCGLNFPRPCFEYLVSDVFRSVVHWGFSSVARQWQIAARFNGVLMDFKGLFHKTEGTFQSRFKACFICRLISIAYQGCFIGVSKFVALVIQDLVQLCFRVLVSRCFIVCINGVSRHVSLERQDFFHSFQGLYL